MDYLAVKKVSACVLSSGLHSLFRTEYKLKSHKKVSQNKRFWQHNYFL